MISLIFEDNHLLILNKPGGMLTQPSGTQQESLEQLAKEWIKAKYQKPGNVFLEAAHRLDKPVSGLVVFAKTSKALTRLNQAMRSKQMRKIYWAWVEGQIDDDEGVLEHFLIHDDFHAKCVTPNHPEAKPAKLKYKVLKRKKDRTLIEIELLTGRYHQIRVQCAEIGHPIWGDKKYGGSRQYRSEAIALHHRQLEIIHVVSQQSLIFEAALPEEFEGLDLD